MKTVDVSENTRASDLKVDRCRQLIEFMRVVSNEGQGNFWTLAQRCVHTKIKPDFHRNYCAVLNQILYESFQVQGNENLMS